MHLHHRLHIAAGSRNYRQLSALTGVNHETIRRYMQGQAPSTDFLARLCVALGINGDWLLTGHGPMRSDDVRPRALAEASEAELFEAVAGSMARLMDRIERLEVYVQTSHARPTPGGEIEPKPVASPRHGPTHAAEHAPPARHEPAHAQRDEAPGPREDDRIARIAAAARRPPSAAD